MEYERKAQADACAIRGVKLNKVSTYNRLPKLILINKNMKFFVIAILITCSFNSNAQITDFEGNIYDTIQIGNQVWLKQNLRSKYYSDGKIVSDSYFVYNNDLKLLNKNGYLYSFKAVTRDSTVLPVQGICPKNFHLPKRYEWEILILNTGGGKIGPYTYSGADYLKDNITWNGINSYGFTILPSGESDHVNGFINFGTESWLWAADGNLNSQTVLFFTNGTNITAFNLSFPTSSDALSCRCVRNTLVDIKGDKPINTNKYFEIFPNPTYNIINFNTNVLTSKSTIFIYNSLGALVTSIPFEKEINVISYPMGFYIILIKTSDNKVYRAKFIKE